MRARHQALWGASAQAEAPSFGGIVAAFLRFLSTAAGESLGAPPSSVVLGRPAFFVDDDPEADAAAERQLEAAARAAGFERIAFQFEPIAAALDYEQSVNAEESRSWPISVAAPRLLGGAGLARARAIERPAPGYSRIPGVHIGGTDFDKQLALARVMPAPGLRSPLRRKGLDAPSRDLYDLATWHRINFLLSRKC